MQVLKEQRTYNLGAIVQMMVLLVGCLEKKGGCGRYNGSYHFHSYGTRKCDVCSYMVETSIVTSNYFNKRFAICRHIIYLPAFQKNKHRRFVYLCEDTYCRLIYVGIKTDVCKRWASTKKACLDKDSSNTGLYKHFKTCCPAETWDISHEHL